MPLAWHWKFMNSFGSVELLDLSCKEERGRVRR